LVLEKVVANFDLQLSETYFKMMNPVYASRIKIHRSGTNALVKSTDRAYKPMYDIVHRTMVGFSYIARVKLYTNMSLRIGIVIALWSFISRYAQVTNVAL